LVKPRIGGWHESAKPTRALATGAPVRVLRTHATHWAAKLCQYKRRPIAVRALRATIRPCFSGSFLTAPDRKTPVSEELQLRIRPATIADLDTVVAFNAAMARETEGKLLPTEVLSSGVRRALMDHSICRYFVAEASGTVIGQTMITLEWSDWRNGFFWWIQSVYVHPDHRRRGVFRALHHHIRDLARREPDVCGLRLYAHRENSRALATYRRLGMHACEYVVCEEDWSP